MKLDVYIVRQGTPESRLLSRAGFDRGALPIAQRTGRRRSHGGFGTTPVAWRVEGLANVTKLCAALATIIGGKVPSQRTSEEQASLDRATRTLTAISQRESERSMEAALAQSRERIIHSFLERRLPCACPTEIQEASVALGTTPFDTPNDLLRATNSLLGGRPAIWANARKTFVRAMTDN